MKCFELKDDTLREGLLIDDESGLPRINIKNDKSQFLSFDARLTAIFNKAPKIAPIRQHYAGLTKDRKTVVASKRNDHLALVLLTLIAGTGGDVTLSGCSFRETVYEGSEQVNKLYGPFPPEGIELLHPIPADEPGPWFGGAKYLELALIMLPGSSFRICRTGRLNGVRPTTFIHWNGYRLLDTPHKKSENTRPRDIPMVQQFDEEEEVVKEEPRSSEPPVSDLTTSVHC